MDEFRKKWINRLLYTTDGYYQLGGRITESIDGDTHMLHLPTFHGWKNESQRRRFYKEAKAVGFSRMKGFKCVWVKKI
jgi:hypothetical protein